MNNERKRLAWRCKTVQQQRDKATIYNSREWKQLRAAKLSAQPTCERCRDEGIQAGIPGGYVRAAHCVHHKVPIESAQSMEEMRRLAFQWDNLQSLCDRCHSELHKNARSHTREAHQKRAADRLERWKRRFD